MRKLIEQEVRSLWLGGYDEGLMLQRPGSDVEQRDDSSYKVRWLEPLRHPTCPQQVVLSPRTTDESFDRVLTMLTDKELLAWLDGLLCQKYR